MSQHKAKIEWKGGTPDYRLGKYTREHTWTFDGGLAVAASAVAVGRPGAVVEPRQHRSRGGVRRVDLQLPHADVPARGALAGFQVESYEDEAVGDMTKNERGVPWISVVTLNPKIVYAGDKRPSHEQEAEMHHKAHDGCFISQSVKTDVKVAGFA